MKLRDYQLEAVDAVEQAWAAGQQSTLVVLPTGMGKTVLFSELAKRNKWSRSLIVAPMRELLKQAAEKITSATGVIPAIEAADLWSNESGWGACPYVVASKQTLTMSQKGNPKRYERFQGVGLLVLDEGHLACTPPVVEMVEHFKRLGVMVLGVTATPNRHDKISLGTVFDGVAYQMPLPQAIDLGWLVPPRSQIIRVKSMDLSQVKVAGGDFQPLSLNSILEAESTELEMADIIAKESAGLKTIVFCSSVAQCIKLTEILSVRYELKADYVCSDKSLCTDEKRAEVLDSFKNDPDGVQIVCNVGVLSLGFDAPNATHLVMAKPTKSLTSYLQMLGRGTRPLPGVVDFTGSTPETRKRAIAWSGKPVFHVTDLCDISLKHRIVNSIDALAGDLPELLRDRYVKDAIDQGPLDPLAKLEEVKQAIAAEAELDAFEEAARESRKRLLEEAKRRRHVKGSVEYEAVQVDLLDGAGIAIAPKPVQKVKKGPVILFGRHKGTPISEVSTGYIRWKLENVAKLAPWYRQLLVKELSKRK